ncbi:hypothetical protein F5B20DRAFT_36744 [Whalleya microplaca]|nr:hypothetical protein F5B20DRAFT_36744 [Whalleya microplaca]
MLTVLRQAGLRLIFVILNALDETRPQCHRCIKAKLRCGGPRSMTIIQYQSKQDGEQAMLPSTELDHQASAIASSIVPLQPAPDILSSVRLSLLEDNVFTSYTYTKLLMEDVHDSVLHGVDRQLAGQCFLALSTTYFGAEHQQPALVNRGLRQYGSALKELNGALSSQSRCRSSDVLVSITIMALFEFLMSSHEDGWISHARGLERFMDLQGPKAFSSLPELFIIEHTQATIIMAALVLRKSTVFSRDEWKYVPWSLYPERKTLLHDLYDILADCTELYVMREDADTIYLDNHDYSTYQPLLEYSESILKQVEEWERNWWIQNPICYEEVPATRAPPLLPGTDSIPVWETVFHFASIYHANAYGLFNAILLLLLQFQQGMVSLASFPVVPDQGVEERILAAGIAVCKSVDYHVEHSQNSAANLFLLLPLRMAHDPVAKRYPSVTLWLNKILQDIQIGPATRWATAKYLLKIGRQRKVDV